MMTSKKRWAALIALSSGMLFASTCEAVLNTIGLAFSIVDVWV